MAGDDDLRAHGLQSDGNADVGLAVSDTSQNSLPVPTDDQFEQTPAAGKDLRPFRVQMFFCVVMDGRNRLFQDLGKAG